jgi:hypothetical protein
VLRDRSHDAVSVAEALGKGTADSDVRDHARNNGYAVLTHDDHYLRPPLNEGITVLYAPNNELGPGEVGALIDKLASVVPKQSDLPAVTYLSDVNLG